LNDRECELFLLAKMPSSPTPKPLQEEAGKGGPLTISSETLLAGRRQLIIQHGNERYRLMLTRSNKLILTK
jgi:hemin uptake protein HemP